jgi:hypothetical protein
VAASCALEGPGPVAGSFGGSLGAGAALGLEPSAWGGSPATLLSSPWGFHLHAHHPFGLEEIGVFEAGGHLRLGRYGGALTAHQVEVEDLYRAQDAELRLSRRFGKVGNFPGTLDFGGGWSLGTVALSGHPRAFGAAQAYGLAWRPLPRLAAGMMARNLPLGARLSDMGGDWEDRGLVWQAGLEACSADPGSGGMRQSLRFDLRKTGGSAWRSLAALGIRPHPAVEAIASLSSDPFQFSLGLRASWAGWSFHQAFRHHRWLGGTGLSTLAFAGPPSAGHGD